MAGLKNFLFKILALVWMTVLLLPFNAFSQEDQNTIVYLFWGDGCPHCSHEKVFLEGLREKYPGLEVRSYEVWGDHENLELFRALSAAYGADSGGVPTTFIGDKVWIGYSDNIGQEIEKKIKQCLLEGCIDAGAGIRTPVAGTAQAGRAETALPVDDGWWDEPDTKVSLPFVGETDALGMSLPAFTVILGGLDGFNPCAFFVLFLLLSLLVHARSRFRMLLVGGIFVLFSGLFYFLFMAAWLNLFMVMGQMETITKIAGIVATVIALINIKEFFFFKKGVSLTIPESAKPALYERMRNVLKAGSVPGAVLGTIFLAIVANTYELLCTAGFPMVFTRVLTLHDLSTPQYYFYLALYNLIYVVPLAAIVIIFATTLGARKLSESQGKTLKLISGLMMFSLGMILIFKPALLNNIAVSIGLVFSVIILSLIMNMIFNRDKNSH